MQRESQSNERESATTDRFLSVASTTSEFDGSMPKSPRNYLPRLKRPSRLTDLKNPGIISTLSMSKCDDDILEIRSIRPTTSKKSSIITINVSGDRFQTRLSTLEVYPDTLLGNESARKPFYNFETDEYFFDRHRTCFEAILYYYQSRGRLRRPEFVPLDTFLEEVAFFQLSSEARDQVHLAENVKEVKKYPMPKALWRRYIWYYFEYPQHTIFARIINLASMFFTFLSCISLAVESLPQYTDHWDNICKLQANISIDSSYVPRCSALFTSPFFIIQTICVAFFTMEFFMRLISTPSYRRFVLSFFNWVDLTAIVPYYVFLVIQLTDQDIGLETSAVLSIRILRILRFSRLFKIYLVFRKLKSLRVLSATIKESLTDFAVLITILALLAFLFGAATYFAEQGQNGDVFDSIPKATYWGIITITGVGYGDMCPRTAAGRILTCFCALLGSSTMGMLVSVLVDRYQRVYNRKMYVTEKDLPSVDINDNEYDSKNSTPASRRSRKRTLSNGIAKRLSSLHERITTDHRNYQYLLSINNISKDENLSENFVATMKNKLLETIELVNIEVNLKLIDNKDKELWTISTPNTSKMHTNDQIKIETF